MTTDVPALGRADAEPVQRPSARMLLWYCIGGSLPERHSTWVLRDVTCRSWLVRHFARTLLIIVPLFAVYMALVPTSLGVRLLTGLTFSGGLFMFSVVNTLIDTDRRAVRAGYAPGLPAHVRSQQAVERQRLASYQRRERIAERQARRRGF